MTLGEEHTWDATIGKVFSANSNHWQVDRLT
jgi:hypothetical protein